MGVCISRPREPRPELPVHFRGKYQCGYRGRYPEVYHRVYGEGLSENSGNDFFSTLILLWLNRKKALIHKVVGRQPKTQLLGQLADPTQ